MPETKLYTYPVLIPNITSTVKSFVKWAGGKFQLLGQFEQLFPREFNNYIEPMVGGGAVFFHLLNKRLIKNKAILADINPELMNCYQIIRDDVVALIAELQNLTEQYSQNPKPFFYNVREWDRQKNFERWPAVQSAARTIFLNKTCYNGLYRVNSKGQFNVPFGRYENPKICDEDNLKAVSNALQNVKLLGDDFEKCLELAEEGDFVYFDPPYHPLSETANFTSYTKENFEKEDQQRLRDTFAKLASRGCQVMLSNSDTKFIRKIYKDFNIHTVYAKRYINSNPEHRGEITEVVITNY